jgi:hypothetical protein
MDTSLQIGNKRRGTHVFRFSPMTGMKNRIIFIDYNEKIVSKSLKAKPVEKIA